MQRDQVELRFRRGQVSASEIQETVDQVLAELGEPDSEAAELAREAGLEPAELASASISVREEPGFDPVTTAIIVGISINVGSHIAVKLWDNVIWPRLKRDRGGQAVGERRAD